MARALVIEEESGTFRHLHPHNGYYAGDFSEVPFRVMPALTPLPREAQGSSYLR